MELKVYLTHHELVDLFKDDISLNVNNNYKIKIDDNVYYYTPEQSKKKLYKYLYNQKLHYSLKTTKDNKLIATLQDKNQILCNVDIKSLLESINFKLNYKRVVVYE